MNGRRKKRFHSIQGFNLEEHFVSIATGVQQRGGKSSSILITIGAVAVLILVLAGMKGFQIYRAMSNKFAPPPDSVTSAVAASLTWEKTFSAVGSIVATQGVVLSAEEAGKVTK